MSYSLPIGILGLVAIAACWALAVVLYRVSTAGTTARQLVLLLVVEGLTLLTAGFPGFVFNAADPFYLAFPKLYFWTGVVHHLGDAAMIALYPPFLASALNTSITRQFSGKGMRIGLAIGAAIIWLFAVFNPSRIAFTLLYSMVTLLFVYALVASIHAWRTAKRGIARERAGIFALAFGLRDLGWCMSYGIFTWLEWTQPELMEMIPEAWLGKVVYALGTLFAIPLIAYGILRGLLFDIDLRVRWTIKQSTVAGVAVAFIYLVSEGADRFLSSELGGVFGLLAAAVVVFLLAPLQRFAEKIASAAMPNTHNTPEYAAHRKMQVYEAAVLEAQQGGGITEKERSLLIRLRDSLGISPIDAEALERELHTLVEA